MKLSKLLLLAVALIAAIPAAAQSSRRAGVSEIYLGPVFTDGKNYSFDGGSSARTDTGYGLSFGYAYNFSQNLQAGFDLAWSEQDYRANVQGGVGNLGNSGTIKLNGATGQLIWQHRRQLPVIPHRQQGQDRRVGHCHQ